MDQAGSIPDSVSASPLTSAMTNEPQLPSEISPLGLKQIISENTASKVAVSPPDVSSGTAPEIAMREGQEAKHSKKRACEEDETEEHPRAKLKRTVKDADVKFTQSGSAETDSLDEANVEVGNDSTADGESFSADEVAQSKKSVRKPKPILKDVLKKATATSRRKPACAECKRRKVRCTHNLAEDGSVDQGNSTRNAARDETVTRKRKPTKAKKADENNPAAQEASTNNDEEPHADEPTPKSNPKKKSAANPSRAPPERTSTRTRKAPERFEKLQEHQVPKTSPPKKGTSRVFDPVYITTNSTSRLGRADIYHMLLEDSAWTSLSAEQQATLVSMLPDSADNQRLLQKIRNGEEDTRPQWLKASDVFRDEVAKFKDDLTSGHLAKTWQAAAEQAVIERAAGDYDDWKAKEAELWWGQKSK